MEFRWLDRKTLQQKVVIRYDVRDERAEGTPISGALVSPRIEEWRDVPNVSSEVESTLLPQ